MPLVSAKTSVESHPGKLGNPLCQQGLSLQTNDDHIVVVDLARNHGHQLALSAGLAQAGGERILIIDADLQDPPELLTEMTGALDAGAEVAYGQRIDRRGETWFKRASAAGFYRFLTKSTKVNIPLDTGDFRLIARCVLNVLVEMPESHRFIRGMIAWIGFRQVPVPYTRDPRFAGETKYPLGKMLLLALDAWTGFATAPLRFVYGVAVIAASFAMLLLFWSIYSYYFENVVPGWSSLAAIVLFFSALNLLSLGIIGEYVGRIFIQSKGRPLFVIRKVHRPPASIDASLGSAA